MSVNWEAAEDPPVYARTGLVTDVRITSVGEVKNNGASVKFSGRQNGADVLGSVWVSEPKEGLDREVVNGIVGRFLTIVRAFGFDPKTNPEHREMFKGKGFVGAMRVIKASGNVAPAVLFAGFSRDEQAMVKAYKDANPDVRYIDTMNHFIGLLPGQDAVAEGERLARSQASAPWQGFKASAPRARPAASASVRDAVAATAAASAAAWSSSASSDEVPF